MHSHTYIPTCLAKSMLKKFIFWIDSTIISYSTEIRLTLIESVERFSDPIKLSTTARRKVSCIYLHIRTYSYVVICHNIRTVVWEKFTVGIFHVKNFMLKYFHLLGKIFSSSSLFVQW